MVLRAAILGIWYYHRFGCESGYVKLIIAVVSTNFAIYIFLGDRRKKTCMLSFVEFYCDTLRSRKK